jgi:hypothetical protein
MARLAAAAVGVVVVRTDPTLDWAGTRLALDSRY